MLLLGGNPFASLVLSELAAAAILSTTVTSLRNDGISVFPDPLTVQLIRLRPPIGAFQFAIAAEVLPHAAVAGLRQAPSDLARLVK
jgi:hypothetical protein